MGNLEKHLEQVSDLPTLTYGLYSLHAWIKFFECLLHISYRLEFRSWEVMKADKVAFVARKKYIQEQFREKMGLLIDVPQSGSGTTNGGNMARRAISSGLEIKFEEFREYAIETAKLYVKYYNWYYMPPSMHKVLIHRGDVIKNAIVPIGLLSEEVLETRNKICRRFRERHTRKFCRWNTMENLFHMLLIIKLPLEVMRLFRDPLVGRGGEEDDVEEDEDKTKKIPSIMAKRKTTSE
ncbi:hypothetical protein PR048_000064 [Dryococelus australis]|uniref:Uncharacterized protein n=1 Tax=Dryococelus australis TaxID=614101 RepID=A0ABQ9IE65_9NEOP|nr:hypothetical protein PR048_000064 [Dryococelus australis]